MHHNRKRNYRIPVMVILTIISLHLFANDSIPHPFLLVTPAQIQQIQNDIKDTSGWKYKSWQQLKHEADRFLAEPLVIPQRGGNWEQYYINYQSGERLKTGKLIGDWHWEHIDPETNKPLPSNNNDKDSNSIENDLDGVVIGVQHNTWALGALQLGLAYQISGNKNYAEKAKNILLEYAALYPGLLPRNRYGTNWTGISTGLGKLFVQNLNEAVWLVNMVQAADLVWDRLSANEREVLASRLFRPAAELIGSTQTGTNIQCWQDAAVGMVGFLTGDRSLVTKAMEDSANGYFALLKKGIGREGLWFEPTPNYHFYALHALVQLAQAAKNYGYNISMQPLAKMFAGPVYLANNSLLIPAFNNSGQISLPAMEYYLYEWAYANYGDAQYAMVLKNHPRGTYANVGPHFTGWSLLYGTKNLPANATGKQGLVYSKNFTAAGIGMLSYGARQNNMVCYVKYNTVKSWHVHPDNPAFAIMKGNDPIVVLSGNPNYYSYFEEHWYKHSLSSNTFLVGEKAQKEALGKCLSFGKENGLDYITAENTGAYDSVGFVRTVTMLNTNLTLVVDQVKIDGAPKLVDIAVHPAGRWLGIATDSTWKSTKLAYAEIKGGNITVAQKESSLTTRTYAGGHTTISAVQDSAMDIITGYGKKFRGEEVPVAIYRRKTNNAVMAYCIAANGEKVKLDMEVLKDDKGSLLPFSTAVKINLLQTNGSKWTFIVNPYKISIKDNPDWQGKCFVVMERPQAKSITTQ